MAEDYDWLAHVVEAITCRVLEYAPLLETVIDTVFDPKTVVKQLALVIVLESLSITADHVGGFLRGWTSTSRQLLALSRRQQSAEDQDEWMQLAEEMDRLQGLDQWRLDPECELYDRARITARIDEFVALLRSDNLFELIFLLRSSLGRHKFGLLQEALFTKAMAGSKVLVETYHSVVCAALDYVCDADTLEDEEPIPTDARLAFFNETRHAYGRTALLLSGGAALGFYHAGVVKTLMENNLLPRVLSGSSAGSLVCAMVGTRTDEECLEDLFQGEGTSQPGHSGTLRLDFFRPLRQYEGNWLQRAGQWFLDVLTGRLPLTELLLHDTDHFHAVVRANIGNFTFQEAFDRTGRILNIVVTPQNGSEPPRLLNYLTAPHVMVWSAAVASSSLPGVFQAKRLLVKTTDGWERYESSSGIAFADGSLEQDLPMQQLSEAFNVNHFIVSQVNPQAIMLASYSQKQSMWTRNPLTRVFHSILGFLKGRVRVWVGNFVTAFGGTWLNLGRGVGAAFLTQEYEGRPQDISLIPWRGHLSFFSSLRYILYNPTQEEFRSWVLAAQRETWRYIPAIKSHIAEEITLDNCVQRLRARLVQESWLKATVPHATEEEIRSRVPSFFNSPSLANLQQLGVVEPSETKHDEYAMPLRDSMDDAAVPELDIHTGWSGMGLRGNRSSGCLTRRLSDASGIYIEEPEVLVVPNAQDPGEAANLPQRTSHGSLSSKGYMKSTSMAKFYYRKSHASLASADKLQLDYDEAR